MPLAPLKPVSDFASAAMLRVLRQGMLELGLNPPPAAPRSAEAAATVSLDEKRQLVGAALAQGGLGCLALLGRGLHRHAHEPSHRALVSARDAGGLFARWARLERYIHSRHHIGIHDVTDNTAQISHMARAGHAPPLPAENLVVLGVLLALLEATCADSVTAGIAGVPVYPEPDIQGLAELAREHRTAAWFIAWAPSTVADAPQRAFDPQPPALVAPETWPDHARRCFSALGKDLTDPLTLSQLARAHGEAPRSLQRRLGRVGLSYSQLLAQARCNAASWWLLETGTPIAEVGFLSGYTDQPHFTRDFRNRVGVTPARFRLDFRAPS